jgi:hypothetical protein
MKLPEHWVVETAEGAKRELSLLLSFQFPIGVLLVAALLPWLRSSEAIMLAGMVGVVLMLFGLPLALIGYATLDYRARRKTVPFTVLALLLISGVAFVCT